MVAVVAAVACSPELPPPPSGPPVPIGPNQRFSGRVNWAGDGVTVFTLCKVGAERGTPVPDQPLTVVADPNGEGDTGASSSAVFVQPMGSSQVEQITRYGVPSYLPADLDVPCNGPGTVTFHQCWGIIACTSGSPDVVEVVFDQVGVPFDPPPPADDGQVNP